MTLETMAKETVKFVSPDTHLVRDHGPFQLRRIFVRPEAANMEPDIQFVGLDESARIDRWRLLAGPIGSAAPSFVCQAISLYSHSIVPGGLLVTS